MALLCVFWLSGCGSLKEDFAKGVDQPVEISSFPEGADVTINNQVRGTTPLTVRLPRKVTHEVKVSAPGYQTQVMYLAPQPNERSDNAVKVGLMEDLGYYVDLSPGIMEARLKHRLVPRSPGADPFVELARKVTELDTLLEQGEIDPIEHHMISDQLVRFYTN